MSSQLSHYEQFENIKGQGKVKSTPKFLGSFVIMASGALVATETVLRPFMSGEFGSMPVLRFVGGSVVAAIGLTLYNNLEREPSDEQLQEFSNQQIPLDVDKTEEL